VDQRISEEDDLAHPGSPNPGGLKTALAEAWDGERPHVERLAVAAAILAAALQKEGMRATLVGGGAVEFYVPGAYTTHDIDFVVEGRSRAAIDAVFTSLGLRRQGRHWVRESLYVEVPDDYLSDPADEFGVGPLTLRVIRKEYILGERIVGFRWWRYYGHAEQALSMMAAFGADLNEEALRTYLKAEQAEHAYDLLRRFMNSGTPVTARNLDELWYEHYR
jgi:hypothetical protein